MRVQVLGSFEVELDSGPVHLTPAQKRILAYLVVRAGHPATAEQIAEAALSNEDGAASVSAVRFHISKTRAALGSSAAQSPVVTTGAGYVLDLEKVTIDAVEFETKVEAAQARLGDDPAQARSLLGEALASWGGDPYGDFRYAEFARPDADRLAELHVAAHESMLDARIRCGDGRGAVPDLEALLTAHPYRESVAGLLMTALVQAGRQADAIAVYDRFSTRLREELALDPPVALRELCEQILNQDLPATGTVPTPRPVPVPLGSFRGRDDALSALDDLCRSSRLITIVGAGGVGKTRLALEYTSRLPADRIVAFADLSAIEGDASVIGEVASALGVRERPGRGPQGSIARQLQGRSCVLVLDNCEHLLDESCAAAAELMRLAPNLSIVATSRERLDVPGEVVLSLAPLGGPNEAEWEDAVALLNDRLGDAGADTAWSDTQRSVARDICQRVEGLPLAIEIVASHGRTYSLEGLDALLGDPLGRATERRRGASGRRQQSLRDTLAWSVGLLDGDERNLLAQLSVFRGSFDRHAVEAICTGQSPAMRIERLVDISLANAEKGGGWYRLMDVVRQYAGRELLDYEAAEELQADHTRYFLAFAQDFAASLGGPDQERRLHLMDRHRGNWLLALGRLMEDDHADAARLAGAAWRYWYLRAEFSFGLSWLDRTVSLLDELPGDVRAAVQHGRALLGFALGRPSEAQASAQDALDCAHEAGDAERACAVLTTLGGIQLALGRVRAGVDAWAQALALSEELADPYRAAISASKLATGHIHLGDLEQADVCAARARSEAERLHDAYASVEAYLASCELSLMRGESIRADEYLGLARAAAEAQGLDGELGWADMFEGRLRLIEGDAAAALALFERATARYERIGIREGIAQASIERGRAYIALGNLAAAVAALDVAELRVVEGAAFLLPALRATQAVAAAEAGRLGDAKRYLDLALERLDEEDATPTPVEAELLDHARSALAV